VKTNSGFRPAAIAGWAISCISGIWLLLAPRSLPAYFSGSLPQGTPGSVWPTFAVLIGMLIALGALYLAGLGLAKGRRQSALLYIVMLPLVQFASWTWFGGWREQSLLVIGSFGMLWTCWLVAWAVAVARNDAARRSTRPANSIPATSAAGKLALAAAALMLAGAVTLGSSARPWAVVALIAAAGFFALGFRTARDVRRTLTGFAMATAVACVLCCGVVAALVKNGTILDPVPMLTPAITLASFLLLIAIPVASGGDHTDTAGRMSWSASIVLPLASLLGAWTLGGILLAAKGPGGLVAHLLAPESRRLDLEASLALEMQGPVADWKFWGKNADEGDSGDGRAEIAATRNAAGPGVLAAARIVEAAVPVTTTDGYTWSVSQGNVLSRVDPVLPPPQQPTTDAISPVVVLSVRIGREGNVIAVRQLRGSDPYLSAAADAVSQWKFERLPVYDSFDEIEAQIIMNFGRG
jgi:hypothetical protein